MTNHEARAREMARECACGRRLIRSARERGTCAQCFVASWSPEKRAAMHALVGKAFRKSRGEQVTDEELTAAIDHAKELL